MGEQTIDRIETVLIETADEIRVGLADRSRAEARNPSGEQQLAADVAADRRLAERFAELDGVGSYASEKREEILDVGDGCGVAVDPLDGSSNLRSNNPVGTIASVYSEDVPTSGADLVAAWFVLFGPITTMVGVRDGDVTERVIVDGEVRDEMDVSIPSEPTVYGFAGRVPYWPSDFADFAGEIEAELKLRYGGAMVADVNQVLTYGGIFSYPAMRSAPAGKLRLQFEGAPMAAIVEAAGGASSDGTQSLLEIHPDELHQRTPVHVGNVSLIERLETALR